MMRSRGLSIIASIILFCLMACDLAADEFVYSGHPAEEKSPVANCFAYSPDDEYLAVGVHTIKNSYIKVWKRDKQTWKPFRDFVLMGTQCPCALCFVDQQIVVLSSIYHEKKEETPVQFDLFNCDLKTGEAKNLKALGFEEEEVLGSNLLAVSPDRKRIACVTNNLTVLNIADGTVVYSCPDQSGAVHFQSDTLLLSLNALNKDRVIYHDLTESRIVKEELLKAMYCEMDWHDKDRAILARSPQEGIRLSSAGKSLPNIYVERQASIAISRHKGDVMAVIGRIGEPAKLFRYHEEQWQLIATLKKSQYVSWMVDFSPSGEEVAVLELDLLNDRLLFTAASTLTIYRCDELMKTNDGQTKKVED
jgi:WD40 repeat protein